MSFEAVNAALALLEIDRIAGKIPVIDPIAVGVKVQAFLTNGSSGKDKRPEGRVEGVPYATKPCDGAFFIAVVGEAHRKAAAHLELAIFDDIASHPGIVNINLRWPNGQSRPH